METFNLLGTLNNSQQYLDAWIYLLFIVVIVDIVTAIAKHLLSPEAEDLDSSMGFKELIKHILLISLVLTFYIYCSIFDLKSYSQVLISFYIANYGISIIENLGAMGIPVPEFIKNKLKTFK